MIRKIYNILAIPALLVHECSHIIMIILLGAKGNGVEINNTNKDVRFEVHYITTKNYKKNLISIAPIFSFIGMLFLIYFSSDTVSVVLSLYTLFFIRVFLPSHEDIKTLFDRIDYSTDIPEYKKSNS